MCKAFQKRGCSFIPTRQGKSNRGPECLLGWGLIIPRGGDTNQLADPLLSHSSAARMPGQSARGSVPVAPAPRGPRGGGCLTQTSLTQPLSFPPAEPEGSGEGPAGMGTPSLLRGKRGGHVANYRIVAPRSRNERG